MDADNWLIELLREIQLERFHFALTKDLQLSRPDHFDESLLKDSDLLHVGLSAPAVRRLRDAVKKYRSRQKKEKFLSKIKIGKSAENAGGFRQLDNASDGRERAKASNNGHRSRGLDPMPVTCLIQHRAITLYEKIGEGSFAVVRRGVWTRPDGKKLDLAVKQLTGKSGLQEDIIKEITGMHRLHHPHLVRLYGLVLDPLDVAVKQLTGESGLQEDIIKEINGMHRLHHPHLVRLYGLVLDPVLMIVELCEGGAMLDRLRHESKPKPRVDKLWLWANQVAVGMAYLEQHGLIHRDLAARNVLLTKDERVAKIGDFGLMRTLPNPDKYYIMTEQKKIPFAWCPPESLRRHHFSHHSDVWSFGVVLWEIFTFGDEPWSYCTAQQILEELTDGRRLTKPMACPADVYTLMLGCWEFEPSARPTFSHLKHSMAQYRFRVGRCKNACSNEPGLLKVMEGEQVLVIDGQPHQYFWLGQNLQTGEIGKLARRDLKIEEKDCISKPLKGSFVHTGHGAIGMAEGWGHPGKIDPIYLRNPMPLISFDDQQSVSSGSSSEGWQSFGDAKEVNGTPRKDTLIKPPPSRTGGSSASDQGSFGSFDDSAVWEPSNDQLGQSGDRSSVAAASGPMVNGTVRLPSNHTDNKRETPPPPRPPQHHSQQYDAPPSFSQSQNSSCSSRSTTTNPPIFNFQPTRYLPPPSMAAAGRPNSCPPQDPDPPGVPGNATGSANGASAPQDPSPTRRPPIPSFELPPPARLIQKQMSAHSSGDVSPPRLRPKSSQNVIDYDDHSSSTIDHPQASSAGSEEDPFVITPEIRRLTLSKPYSQHYPKEGATVPSPPLPPPPAVPMQNGGHSQQPLYEYGAVSLPQQSSQQTKPPTPPVHGGDSSGGSSIYLRPHAQEYRGFQPTPSATNDLHARHSSVDWYPARPSSQPIPPPKPTHGQHHVNASSHSQQPEKPLPQPPVDKHGTSPHAMWPVSNASSMSSASTQSSNYGAYRRPPINYFPDRPAEQSRITWHATGGNPAPAPATMSQPRHASDSYATRTLEHRPEQHRQLHNLSASAAGNPRNEAVLNMFDPLSDRSSSASSNNSQNNSVASATIPGPSGERGRRSSSKTGAKMVQAQVPFADLSRCERAIVAHSGSVEDAIRSLKVEKLTDLGIGSKAEVWSALDTANWDMDIAASVLLSSA